MLSRRLTMNASTRCIQLIQAGLAFHVDIFTSLETRASAMQLEIH